jgi:hypothetical protein
MNVRKQILVALVSLGTPLAAFASSTPATSGQVEAAERSGQVTAGSAAPTPDVSRRVHELVVYGASYNDAAVQAAEAGQSSTAAAVSPPTRDELEQGVGYAPSSYAVGR